jgi:CheY-like chemotaxis protein
MKLKTVLLVDDDEDDIALFREALQELTSEISLITANNGQQALDLIRENYLNVDHIFLDINMPIMTGVECLEVLSAENKILPPSVTMYTTSGMDNRDYDRCVQLGAGFLTKPNSYTALVHSLNKRLQQGI